MGPSLAVDAEGRKEIFAKRLVQFSRGVSVAEEHVESSRLSTGLEEKLLTGVLRKDQSVQGYLAVGADLDQAHEAKRLRLSDLRGQDHQTTETQAQTGVLGPQTGYAW